MQYTVKQGDCLSSIAHRFGFCDWHVLWDHPSNAAFKAKRKNPNIIYPGDVLFIPVKEPKLEDCPTEQRHTFQLGPREPPAACCHAPSLSRPGSRSRLPPRNRPRRAEIRGFPLFLRDQSAYDAPSRAEGAERRSSHTNAEQG